MEKGIDEIIGIALDKIKNATSADCVVGERIEIDGTTIIPVCRISAGYVTGGGEYGNKTNSPFLSGGIGGGYGVKPVAFICVSDGKTQIIPVDKPTGLEVIVDVCSSILKCFNGCDCKGGKKKK